jgi:predicted RNA binding protein YcfA (HicA-like mRNA interferase family)
VRVATLLEPRACLGEEGSVPPIVREIIAELEMDGWRIVRQRGSHRHFKHPTKRGRVTVSGSLDKPIPAGTLSSIRRQSGLPQLGRPHR